jgi:hypothetical protein
MSEGQNKKSAIILSLAVAALFGVCNELQVNPFAPLDQVSPHLLVAATGIAGGIKHAFDAAAGHSLVEGLVSRFRKPVDDVRDGALAAAAGRAIAQILNEQLKSDFVKDLAEDEQKAIVELIKNVENNWAHYKSAPLTKADLADIYKVRVGSPPKVRPELDDWLTILRAMTFKRLTGSTSPMKMVPIKPIDPTTIEYLAERLLDEFPRQVQIIIEHEAANGGSAHVSLILALLGEISAATNRNPKAFDPEVGNRARQALSSILNNTSEEFRRQNRELLEQLREIDPMCVAIVTPILSNLQQFGAELKAEFRALREEIYLSNSLARVFVSYSLEIESDTSDRDARLGVATDTRLNAIKSLMQRLRHQKLHCVSGDDLSTTNESWLSYVATRIGRADTVIVVPSASYARYYGSSPAGPSQQIVATYGPILSSALYNAPEIRQHHNKIAVVCLKKSDACFIPGELQGYPRFCLEDDSAFEYLLSLVVRSRDRVEAPKYYVPITWNANIQKFVILGKPGDDGEPAEICLPRDLPDLTDERGGEPLQQTLDWKRIHTVSEKLYREYRRFQNVILECEAAQRMFQKETAANCWTKGARKELNAHELRKSVVEFEASLQLLGPNVRNTEAVRALSHVPHCFYALDRTVGETDVDSRLCTDTCDLTNTISEYLLSALRLADRSIEIQLEHIVRQNLVGAIAFD